MSTNVLYKDFVVFKKLFDKYIVEPRLLQMYLAELRKSSPLAKKENSPLFLDIIDKLTGIFDSIDAPELTPEVRAKFVSQLFLWRAYQHFFLKDYAQAKLNVDHALELLADNALAYYVHACILMDLGNEVESMKALEIAMSKDLSLLSTGKQLFSP